MTITQVTSVAVQPKIFLKSMSIWGAFAQVVSMIVAVAGPLMDATGYSNPVQPGDVEIITNTGAAAIGAVGTLAGAIMVIVGRLRAGRTSQPITFTPNAAPVSVIVVPASPPSQAQPFPKKSG
jgi:uncharacterized membrane protein